MLVGVPQLPVTESSIRDSKPCHFLRLLLLCKGASSLWFLFDQVCKRALLGACPRVELPEASRGLTSARELSVSLDVGKLPVHVVLEVNLVCPLQLLRELSLLVAWLGLARLLLLLDLMEDLEGFLVLGLGQPVEVVLTELGPASSCAASSRGSVVGLGCVLFVGQSLLPSLSLELLRLLVLFGLSALFGR